MDTVAVSVEYSITVFVVGIVCVSTVVGTEKVLAEYEVLIADTVDLNRELQRRLASEA